MAMVQCEVCKGAGTQLITGIEYRRNDEGVHVETKRCRHEIECVWCDGTKVMPEAEAAQIRKWKAS